MNNEQCKRDPNKKSPLKGMSFNENGSRKRVFETRGPIQIHKDLTDLRCKTVHLRFFLAKKCQISAPIFIEIQILYKRSFQVQVLFKLLVVSCILFT